MLLRLYTDQRSPKTKTEFSRVDVCVCVRFFIDRIFVGVDKFEYVAHFPSDGCKSCSDRSSIHQYTLRSFFSNCVRSRSKSFDTID